MAFRHKALAAGRWQKFSLAEQLGNTGSEVNRARRWEIARAREVFCDAVYGGKLYKSLLPDIVRYFDQFALAARLNK